ADGTFRWIVPAITADLCRIEIRSNDDETVAGVSRVFTISGPSVRVSTPNGGECWEPGRVKKIEWQSVGNDVGTVRLEYNLDGSDTEFPFEIATGLANDGSFDWLVPETLTETAKIRASFENADDIDDVSDEGFRISGDCGVKLLVWSPCPVEFQQFENFRTSIEDRVTEFDLRTTNARTAASLREGLEGRDALAIPLMSICQTVDYEIVGGRYRSILHDFVSQGGVVAFVGPNSFSSRLMAGLDLISRLRVVAAGGLTCEVGSYLHPIVSGVPFGFEGPFSTSSYTLFDGAFESVVESSDGTVIASQEQGFGRWVVLGFNYLQTNEVSEILTAQSVQWRPLSDGLRVTSPESQEVFSAGDPIRIEWAVRGLEEADYEVSIQRGDGAFETVGVATGTADGGSIDWVAPMPADGDYQSFSVRVRSLAPDGPNVDSEEPFHVTRARLEIATGALPEARLGAEYIVDIEIEGGVPPFRVDSTALPSGLFLASPDGDSRNAPIRGVPLETVTDYPVAVSITDALGSEAQAEYITKVLPSRIILQSPGLNEFLLAGSTYELDWEIRGYVGESLRVEYNLTGSSSEFDFVAAESITPFEKFTWTVPDAVSDRCRVRIVSDVGLESVSPGAFTITGPGITCLFPNGDESFDTSSTRTVRWRSLGNPSGLVNIDVLYEGRGGNEIERIGTGVPDTGAFNWDVSDDAWEVCRVRVSASAGDQLTDVSDQTFSIRHNNSVRALVWIPFTSHDRLEVRGAIAAITNHEFDFDWRLSVAREPDDLRRELRGKETFVMVQQDRRPEVSFPSRGRELGPVLEDFAENGGTVVVLKQQGGARDFLAATGLLDVTELGSEYDVECEVALEGHPLTNQLPETFTTLAATSWYEVNGDDVDVYATHDGQPVALGRDVGDGRVVQIGIDFRDFNASTSRLIANAVRMVRDGVSRTPFVRGDANVNGTVDIADAIFLLSFLFLGGSDPVCLDAADVDDSSVLGSPRPPININDPVFLLRWLFGGGAPIPPPFPVRGLPVEQNCGLEIRERDGLGCEGYSLCAG
ncbi:MAG: hypothetical protein AAF517_02280, partial [Planctomycetota bacterium]